MSTDDRAGNERTNDDRDLHGILCGGAARGRSLCSADPFPSLSTLSLTRAHGRRRLSGKLAVAATCLAVLIAAVVWLLPGSRVAHEGSDRGREQATASISSWKPATDFLLAPPAANCCRAWPGHRRVACCRECSRSRQEPSTFQETAFALRRNHHETPSHPAFVCLRIRAVVGTVASNLFASTPFAPTL